jgi:ABC-type oligopeptide transport system substrate-binding subunit
MKLQRNRLLIFLLAFVFISGSYSATPPKYGGVLRFAISQTHISLDPIKILTPTDYYIANSIFDGLVRYGSNKAMLPGVASSWEVSDDQIVFTFHIADSAKFHNGKKVTAADVKYSLQRSIRHADFESLEQSGLKLISGADIYRSRKSDHIQGLQVLDENTIQISLAKADSTFSTKLDSPLTWIVPKDSAEKVGFNQHPTGSGPFKLASSSGTEGEILNLEANEEYAWGRPYLDEMIFVSASDFGTLLLRFETGDLDCLEVPNIEFGRFRNDPSWSSQLNKLADSELVCIQINKKSFAGKGKITSLLRYGVDVTSILEMLYNQGTSLSDVDYQLERAKKEAVEFQNKQIKLIVWDSEDVRKIADRIAFDLAKAGVILGINPLNCQDFQKALDEGAYSLALLSLPSSYHNIDNLNKSVYFPLFYQNTSFLQKPDIQGLSESSSMIQLDEVYFLKAQKK